MPDDLWIFRIYSPDRKTFKDYAIVAYDLAIEINDKYAHIFDTTVEGGFIDYPEKIREK